MKPYISFTKVFEFLLIAVIFLTVTEIAEAQANPDITKYVFKGDSKALSTALSNGADVNQQTKIGNTPLMVAAKIGDRPTIEVLLSHNADVNLRNNAGATALMIAVKHDNPHVVTLLLDNGADPTIKNKNGHTASNFALAYKRFKIYDQLKLAERSFSAQKQNI